MQIEAVLRDALEAAAEQHALPGAAAGVVVGDEDVIVTTGVGNVEQPRPVSADTLFQIGSITKTFTSTAMLLLVEDGRVALDDPVARHLPDLAATTGLDTEAITIEHTLSHQSGFDGDHLFVARARDELSSLADTRRLFEPGTGYSYSNAGFSIAGEVIEAVAGQPFDTFVRERLLRPLRMRSASFTADRAITHDVAAPHVLLDGEAFVLRAGGWQPGWELNPVDWAAGGLAASAAHLLTWCRFQRTGATDDGTVLLSPESLARLHRPLLTADLEERVALDWFVRDHDGIASIEHSGTTAGYQSNLLVVPDRDFAFVGLTNATHGAKVHRSVRRAALSAFAGIDERDPEPDPALPHDLRRVCGRYEHAFAVLEVAPGTETGTVVIRSSKRDVDGWQPPLDPPITCGFSADDHVVSVDDTDPTLIGRFDAEHDPADWLLWGSRRALRLM